MIRPRTLLDVLILAHTEFPSELAVIVDSESYCYSEVFELATCAAEHLRTEGAKEGCRICLLLGNSVEFVIYFWAVQLIGGVVVPLSPKVPLAKLNTILNDFEPSLVLCSQELTQLALDGFRFSHVHSCKELLSKFEGKASGNPTPSSIDQDDALIVYTSGSTGSSMGVVLSQLNVLSACDSVASYLGIRHDDKIFASIPMSFDYGLHQITMAAMVGACLVVEASFSQPLFSLGRLQNSRATIFPIVPSMASLIKPVFSRFDLSSVRMVTSTGAVLHQASIEELGRMFPNAMIYSMYGLTECHRCTILSPEHLKSRPESVGKAIPNTELWVVNDRGEIRERNCTGELVVRGSTVMKKYLNRTQESAKRLRQDVNGEKVLYTGDLVRIDKEGFVYFISRTDDIFIVDAQKVAPSEIERVLQNHPLVVECAVIAVKDKHQGHVPVAFVSLANADNCGAELQAWCNKHLESFCVPKQIIHVTELRKNSNGKIIKSDLARYLDATD